MDSKSFEVVAYMDREEYQNDEKNIMKKLIYI